MLKFTNILITGATSGIGKALALHYAASGALNLFICGRNQERLGEIARRCRELGADVHPRILDVTDREELSEWILQAAQNTSLDLVIANAGVSSLDDTPASTYNLFNTNVTGVLNTVLPAIEAYRTHPRTSPRAIAITASLAGYHGLAGCPDYSASKACVKAWGEALRLKLAAEKININVICPGFVRSRITDRNTFPMPFFMEADRAAAKIAAGISHNNGIIAFPWPLRFAVWLLSILPNCLSDYIYAKLPHKV